MVEASPTLIGLNVNFVEGQDTWHDSASKNSVNNSQVLFLKEQLDNNILKNNNFQSNPTTMITTSSIVFDASWYLDSRASNHITPTLSNVTNRAAYNGIDQIYLANGTCIAISHLGCAKVQQNFSSKPLFLNHLHAPSASKNLISVSMFAFDNNVVFLASSSHFLCEMSGFQ